jgi:nucleoside-diphosphate-sugar epimerase
MDNTGNILIVGSNSTSGILLAKSYKKKGSTVYGISRAKNFTGVEIYKQNNLFSESYENIYFDEVVIIASRVPANGGVFEDFAGDNLNILYKGIAEAKNISKIVFFSSFSIYDQSHSKITLETPYDIHNAYGLSKLLCENYLKDNANNYLILRVPVLLYSGVRNNFMARLKDSIKNKSVFSFANIDSRVNTFFSLNDFEKINSQYSNQTINCCTRSDWKIEQIIEYSLSLGLSDFNVVKTTKQAQIVIEEDIPVCKTSEAIKDFLNE